MKKLTFTALWTAALLVLSAVTAFADVAPLPEPVTAQAHPELIVLIVAVVIVAAASIVWIVIRNRRK
jgi:hypothetical protein